LLNERILNKGIQAKTEESLLYTDRLRNNIFQSFNKVLPSITELLSVKKSRLPKQKKLHLDLTKANSDINKFLNTWKEWKYPNAAPILLFDKKLFVFICSVRRRHFIVTVSPFCGWASHRRGSARKTKEKQEIDF